VAISHIRSSLPDLALFDRAAVPIIVLGARAELLWWNDACREKSGFSADEVLRRTVWELAPFEHSSEVWRKCFERQGRELQKAVRADLETRDGQRLAVTWTLARVSNALGETDYVVATATEILEKTPKLSHRTLVDSIDDYAVYLLDDKGKVSTWNAGAERLKGYSEKEVLGRDYSLFFTPEDLELNRPQAILEIARTQGRHEELSWRVRKDGTRFFAHAVLTAVRDDTGRVIGFAKVTRDTTRERLAEEQRRILFEQLARHERLLSALLGQLPVAVVMRDSNGKLLTYNEQSARLLTLPDDLGAFDHLHGKTVQSEPLSMPRPDGTVTLLEVTAGPVFDAAGGIEGSVMVLTDVTSRRVSELAHRRQEAVFRAVLDVLPVGMWITDRDRKVTMSNPAGRKIWGETCMVGAEDPSAYRAWSVLTGAELGPSDWPSARAIATGEPVIGEMLRVAGLDGVTRTVLASAVPLRDADGTLFGSLVVNDDVSDLRETEERLREALTMRDEMMRIVSHDLRTPLNVIIMSTNLVLRRRQGLDADMRSALESAVRAARQMNRLVQDLVDGTRIDSGRFSVVAAPETTEEILREAAENARTVAGERRISVRAEADLPHVLADRERLLQLFANLIGNAVKFTDERGHIEILARRRENEVVFGVRDDGSGIAPEHLPHLFDRFFHASEDRRGLGLGLAISKAIVEAHGGKLWVESVQGRGTTFSFTMPISQRVSISA
jgi:PAS domain S-box-containing protein